MDFAGVTSFSAASIESLVSFKQNLQTRGLVAATDAMVKAANVQVVKYNSDHSERMIHADERSG